MVLSFLGIFRGVDLFIHETDEFPRKVEYLGEVIAGVFQVTKEGLCENFHPLDSVRAVHIARSVAVPVGFSVAVAFTVNPYVICCHY